MNKIVSIAPSEISFNVALLHQVLEILGARVEGDEVAKRLAGAETKEKVRALQKQLGIVPNERLIVDPPTSIALERSLKERGLIESSRSFDISGSVLHIDGTPSRQRRLLAFDLDLRAVGVYRSIKTIAELDKNGGFEFLGHTVSDSDGKYTIKFYDWQYQRAERKKADVVVYAVTESRDGIQILGHSRLVMTQDYSDKGIVGSVDVLLPVTDDRIEYARMMDSVIGFLEESRVDLYDAVKSPEQIRFIASELDLELNHVQIIAAAHLLLGRAHWQPGPELLYGIGRQGIELTWPSLYRRTEKELLEAIEASVKFKIIDRVNNADWENFVKGIRTTAVEQLVADNSPDHPNVDSTTVLPDRSQRIAFLDAVTTFQGSDFREFWDRHLLEQPAFKNNPELVSRLLLHQQLSAITAGFEPLVKQLISRQDASAESLLEIKPEEWDTILSSTGVPELVPGDTSETRVKNYAEMIQGTLNAAFPTQRLAILAKNDQLPIDDSRVALALRKFFSSVSKFDVARSQVDTFDQEIVDVAGENAAAVKSEIKKLQRVFQVSPTPDALTVLLEKKLHSASAIAQIPRKAFLQNYGPSLGGEDVAFAVHQRAEHIARRSERAMMHMLDHSRGKSAAFALTAQGAEGSNNFIKNNLPNYSDLFGSPDLCECEHCRSVLSPAAYYVELLRFLRLSGKNDEDKSPLEILDQRRPDLKHLLLTCENTNTTIPYIDLAMEVMEYYTAKDSLDGFKGYDTANATSEELRANAQNIVIQAYKKLSEAKYPFNLPYHQPLDVLRTYGDHLGVSRAEWMRATNPKSNPDLIADRAIAAESLCISEEEYETLTGESFDGTAKSIPVHVYYGYAAPSDMEQLKAVRTFLARSGISYIDLVELIKTRFVNPNQPYLETIGRVLAKSPIDAKAMYSRFAQVRAGTLNPSTDSDITAMISAYNVANGTDMTATDLATWLTHHFDNLRSVITLYTPDSSCDLDKTQLRTVSSLNEGRPDSGLSESDWSRMHRFLRLKHRLGWSIGDTDIILEALRKSDIDGESIVQLEAVAWLASQTKLPLSQLAVLWGNIESRGEKSLYRRLFLNKAVQQVEQAFLPNAWGEFLTDSSKNLADQRSAIQAALSIREEDLDAIASNKYRPLNLNTDRLSIENLSVIYRHVLLAKVLKLSPAELPTMIRLYGESPVSYWDVVQNKVIQINPANTKRFYEFVESARNVGFNTEVLAFVLGGDQDPSSKLGLDHAKALQVAPKLRQSLAEIEFTHPDSPPSPMTPELLAAKLSMVFPAETVGRFLEILQGTATFSIATDKNLNVTIPGDLAGKYTYTKSSGRLNANGVMTDDQRTILLGIPGVPPVFLDAVNSLYSAPKTFLETHFSKVFAKKLDDACKTLLDQPKQAAPATFEERLVYVYRLFVPILKQNLKLDMLTQHIANAIGLDTTTTAVLITGETDKWLKELSKEGFSADYFSDDTWNTKVTTTDAPSVIPVVDFDWQTGSPDNAVPADKFSVRWQAYLAPPASGEYTVLVEVAEADESFKLYLDDVLVLENALGGATTQLEASMVLNSTKLHSLRLDYSEGTQSASVRLKWKRGLTDFETIPPAVVYPHSVMKEFLDRMDRWCRAAKFISTFKLTAAETNYFATHQAEFENIDLTDLKRIHWERVRSYTQLRDAVPQARATILELFGAASTQPSLQTNSLIDWIHLATAWGKKDIQHLVSHFNLGLTEFKNEIWLCRLLEAIGIVRKTGLAAVTITALGAIETNFDKLHESAQRLRNAVKAKYDEQEWMEVAGGLSDKLRERQKEALIAHLLTRPEMQSWGATDADGLFEYFLIDVQMCACMDTSRVVQASAAVQMFVNRCLLNIESDRKTDKEVGVSPHAIDKERWEWMKNYRVWQANREIFLFPENWLAPEWRRDRSELFKGLESYLVQNDISDRTVETAFRNYLTGLAEIGNLEMCGLHQEYDRQGKPTVLHAFGRTRHAPYSFYYRTWSTGGKWSAWEKVPVSIRVVENEENTGVHLLPVVWKKRLFLFWPEFNPHQEKATKTDGQSPEQCGKETKFSEMEGSKYWEINLAWSEYVDGRWTPKQVSSVSYKQKVSPFSPVEMNIRWIHEIDSLDQLHLIGHVHSDFSAWLPGGNNYYEFVRFSLADITATITCTPYVNIERYGWYGYEIAYQNYVQFGSPLRILGDNYCRNTMFHKVLAPATRRDYTPQLDVPFFFHDRSRTYFVRPVDVRIYDWILHPLDFSPRFPVFEADLPWWKKKLPTKVDRDPIIDIRPELGELWPVSLRDARSNFAIPSNTGTERENATPAIATKAPILSSRVIGKPLSKANITQIKGAFMGVSTFSDITETLKFAYRMDKGLEFHTFYHPFSSAYVTRLNQLGMPGLMESDTDVSLRSDEGTTFQQIYDPDFTNGRVQKPSDFSTRTYYKDNVCFDPLGANSQYNWELFFHAPLYIATRLSRNGRHHEAMKWFHYIFDPTSDVLPAAGEPENARYWKIPPFKTDPAKSLEEWFRTLLPNSDVTAENDLIRQWRDHPFDPHLIASNRPFAYMKHVVLAYVQNLVDWADMLFRQDSRESVNEALQLYVMASHILGPKPERVPQRGTIKPESYHSLEAKWNDFSNALVELENQFPFSSDAPVSDGSTPPNLLGIGSQFYFAIPTNEQLQEHWDGVADRLYKIRHCQNIDGVERKLALFAPRIDPGAIVNALSQGLSLGSILADLSSPPSIYRFRYLIQKAIEYCNDVKALGAALHSAIEKKDGEELSRLRAMHEHTLLELMRSVKTRQLLDARARRESVGKQREAAVFRMQHYADLLGTQIEVPKAPTINAELTEDSALPGDTVIPTITPDVDLSLVDSDESGIKVIPREKNEIDSTNSARKLQRPAEGMESLAAIAHTIPTLKTATEPFGVGLGLFWGPTQLANAFSAAGRMLNFIAADDLHGAALAQKMSGYIRREQDWAFQANVAAKDIIQLDKQIASADIQVQVAQKELENHDKQVEHSLAIEQFLAGKFTSTELYQWQKEQLFDVYKRSFNLAYELAKKAEKAYRFEIGEELTSFIQYGYWEDAKQGLVAGERLQLALRQLENAYLNNNRRELELTRSISLAELDPLALVELRERGKCRISLPEEFFDRDFCGHYYRRIKAIRLSIPCIAGPHTTIGCSLRLLNSTVRINAKMNLNEKYEHLNDEGVWIDDDRFRTVYTPVTAIATSTGQSDSGIFELNFNDERYLPFEFAGVISDWEIELSTEKELRQFDQSTISDVIMQMNYTARETGGRFKTAAQDHLKNYLKKQAALGKGPLTQMFNLRKEFPSEWHKFLYPAEGDQVLRLVLGNQRFPFVANGRKIVIDEISLIARCKIKAAVLEVNMSFGEDSDPSSGFTKDVVMSPNEKLGGLVVGALSQTDIASNSEGMDVSKTLSIKLKTEPKEEVGDMYLIMAYHLE